MAYAKQSNADLVIHGGDLFYRTLVPEPIVDMVYERIFNLAQSGIPIVIVPGNHESSRLPVSLFMHHPNIHYFTKPQIFKFCLKGKNIDIAGFPCIRKDVKAKFPEIAKEIQLQLSNENIKLLCMHQSIEGAKVGPSDYTFRISKDVIPMEDIPSNYDLILSGHIHRTQLLLAKNKTPIIYPGSIERTAFAEKEEEKGFYEIEFNDKLNYTYRFIKLKTRPMIDIVLEKENYTSIILKEEILYKIKKIPAESIVRFKMKNTSNLPLLNVKFLDELIPTTMNYQVAGLRELYSKK
jgi:DNA repair exonuclease SbcCD nuclease subunit